MLEDPVNSQRKKVVVSETQWPGLKMRSTRERFPDARDDVPSYHG